MARPVEQAKETLLTERVLMLFCDEADSFGMEALL